MVAARSIPGAEAHIFRSSIPAPPIPPHVTVPEFVLLHPMADPETAGKLGARVAFVDASDGRHYTYGQTRDLVKNVAAGLHNLVGVNKGDVVFVLLPNMAEYFIAVLGIMWAGAVFSGSNPFSHPSEIEKQILDSEAKALVTDIASFEKVKQFRHRLPIVVATFNSESHSVEPVLLPEGTISMRRLFEYDGSAYTPNPAPSQDDVCALPYSSGTTGLPKGVKLTHRNLLANIIRTCLAGDSHGQQDVDADRKYVVLGLMPLFHIYGITGICCCTMRFAGAVVVMARFDLRHMLAAMVKHEVNFVPLVPPIILEMVKSPVVDEFDLSKLKLEAVMTAAAPLAPELQRAFEARFPGVEVRQAYGLTEYSCVTLSHVPPGFARGNSKKGSVGFLVAGVEMKVVEQESGASLPANGVGEIYVRGDSTMQGYFKNDEATSASLDAQGWFRTGDVGYIDADGDVFIVDRAKELIKYKGFQVPPAELEAILVAHPLVADAAVIPLPDEEAGEIPAACVVRAGHDSSLTEDDVKTYVQAQVASYKKVRHVEFVSTIPKSPSGKILRRLLRDDVLKKLQRKTSLATDSIQDPLLITT